MKPRFLSILMAILSLFCYSQGVTQTKTPNNSIPKSITNFINKVNSYDTSKSKNKHIRADDFNDAFTIFIDMANNSQKTNKQGGYTYYIYTLPDNAGTVTLTNKISAAENKDGKVVAIMKIEMEAKYSNQLPFNNTVYFIKQ